jgi:predicted ATPase
MVGGRGISVQRLREIENKPDMRAIKAAEQAARKRAALRGELYEGENNDMQPEEEEEEEDLLSPDDSVAVLTGANGSGKSVFLKMVAIIVYMVR